MAMQDDDPLRRAHQKLNAHHDDLMRRFLARWGVMPMPSGSSSTRLPNDGNGPVDKPGVDHLTPAGGTTKAQTPEQTFKQMMQDSKNGVYGA